MTLYKYVKFEDLERILNGSIRFTQPGAFNDPFEMVPELLVPKHLANRQVNLQFSVTAPRRTSTVHELADDFDSEDCSDINSRRILASLNQQIGVLSLSKNSSSLLMWSHYADRHKGAIIELDASHEFLEGKFAVDYREFRPKIDIGSYLDDETPIPIAELCVKPKDWEYEDEVRVVRNLSDCECVDEADGFPIYTRQLPIDCLKAVILGERMELTIKEEFLRQLRIPIFPFIWTRYRIGVMTFEGSQFVCLDCLVRSLVQERRISFPISLIQWGK